MSSGRSSIGMSKHRTSGKTSYSPKTKHAMKRNAEKVVVKNTRSGCKHNTVRELLNKNVNP